VSYELIRKHAACSSRTVSPSVGRDLSKKTAERRETADTVCSWKRMERERERDRERENET